MGGQRSQGFALVPTGRTQASPLCTRHLSRKMGAGASHPSASHSITEDYKEELIRMRMGEGAMGKEIPAFLSRAAKRSPRLESEWATSLRLAGPAAAEARRLLDASSHGS